MLTRSASRLGGLFSSVSGSSPALSSLLSSSNALLPSVSSTTPSSSPLIPTSVSLGGVRFATSKAGGSTKNGRDSNPKYLGVRRYGGQWVEPGNIILLQRGQRFGIVESTATVAFGKDWNIYALKSGYVHFWWHAMKKKYFVEILRNPPASAQGGEAEKYPIVRLKDWELPELLKIPASTPISDTIRARLVSYLRSLPPAKLALALPRGKTVVGGLTYETVVVSSSSQEEAAAVPAMAAAPAKAAAAAAMA